MFVYIFDRVSQKYHIKDYDWGYSKDMAYCGAILPKLVNNSFAVDMITENICSECLSVHKRYCSRDNSDPRAERSQMIMNLEFILEYRENKYERDYRKFWPKLTKAKGKQVGNKLYEKVHKSQNLSKYKKH